MRKIYETPEIMVTRFDLDRSVMDDSGNQGPGDKWDAGVNPESEPYTNPDLPGLDF